jgi:hypothetical protein
MRAINALAAIEYVGLPGISEESKQAIMRMVHYRDQIVQARILSHDRNHCFLLTVNVGDLVAIKSGFSSGYLGEGPRAFSYVLQLLDAHGVDIEEYDVSADVIERVDFSALRQRDLHAIDKARPIRPTRWYDYIIDERFERGDYARLWQEFNPVIPLAIVDARITDLAMRFYQAPDDCLGKGYRRLEDLVRTRINSEQHGAKLFQEAFLGEDAKLSWPRKTVAERAARCSLFISAYGAFRNPRAHRELESDSHEQTMEFLLLNHLYSLEQKAVEV